LGRAGGAQHSGRRGRGSSPVRSTRGTHGRSDGAIIVSVTPSRGAGPRPCDREAPGRGARILWPTMASERVPSRGGCRGAALGWIGGHGNALPRTGGDIPPLPPSLGRDRPQESGDGPWARTSRRNGPPPGNAEPRGGAVCLGAKERNAFRQRPTWTTDARHDRSAGGPSPEAAATTWRAPRRATEVAPEDFRPCGTE